MRKHSLFRDCWKLEWIIFRFLTYKSSQISLVLPFSWVRVLNYCFGNKCRVEWQNQNLCDIIKHSSTLFKQTILLYKYSAIIPIEKYLILFPYLLLANNNSDNHMKKWWYRNQENIVVYLVKLHIIKNLAEN